MLRYRYRTNLFFSELLAAISPGVHLTVTSICAQSFLRAASRAFAKDPASDAMKLIHERRKMMRAIYKENDPGVGALDKFLGSEMAEVALSIIEP